MAAYAYMTGVANVWERSTIVINGKTLRLVTLTAAPHISMVWIRLPDGNLNGSGTSTYGYQSLQKLWASMHPGYPKNITSMRCVDNSNTFTYATLVSTLTGLMEQWEPTYISAQDHKDTGAYDHSDHTHCALFVQLAHKGYTAPHIYDSYLGYTSLSFPTNIGGATLLAKQNTFFTYAQFDDQVCSNMTNCKGNTYLDWMQRQWIIESVTSMAIVADAGGDRNGMAKDLITLDGSNSYEQSGLTITYQWTQLSGPTQSLSSTTSAMPTFTAPNFATTLSFQLVVKSSTQTSSPDTIVIDVLAPIADAGSDQSVLTLEVVTLSGAASTEPSSLPLTYAWTQISGPTVSLSSTSAVAPTFTAPSVSCVLVFRLVVSNGRTPSVADSVSITAMLPLPPLVTVGPDQSVQVNAFVTLTAAGTTDPHNLSLTYTWQRIRGTAVTLSNAAAISPTFTAPSNSSRLMFRLAVSNGQTSTTAVVGINVTQADAPLADAGGDQRVLTQAIVTLSAANSGDPSNLPLTFAWVQLSGVPVLLSSTSAVSVTFQAPANATTLLFQLTASNGQSASGTQVQVDVIPVQAPLAGAGMSRTVAAFTVVSLDGSTSTDPQSFPLTFEWQQTSGPSVLLSSPSAMNPSLKTPSIECALTFQLIVRNGQKSSAPAFVTLNVTPPPVDVELIAHAGSDQAVLPGLKVTLDASGSRDPSAPAAVLSFQWTQLNGTKVRLSSDSVAAPSFTAPLRPSILLFQLVVSNGKRISQPDTVTVAVGEQYIISAANTRAFGSHACVLAAALFCLLFVRA